MTKYPCTLCGENPAAKIALRQGNLDGTLVTMSGILLCSLISEGFAGRGSWDPVNKPDPAGDLVLNQPIEKI